MTSFIDGPRDVVEDRPEDAAMYAAIQKHMEDPAIMRCVASAGQVCVKGGPHFGMDHCDGCAYLQFFDPSNGWYNVEACLAQAIERMCDK